MEFRFKFVIVVIAVISWMAPTHNSYAVEYSWRPQLRMGARATDNLRSSTTEKEAAVGFDTGGGLSLKAETENWQSTLIPSFNFRRFAIGENADADEYGVKAKNQYAVNERTGVSLQFDYLHDSTLSTELDDNGGVRTDILGRDTITVSPSVNYALSDKTLLNLEVLYSDVSFESRPRSGYVDYKYEQIVGGVSRYLTRQISLRSSFFVNQFETPDTGGKSITYGGQVGGAWAYSDSLSITADVGYSISNIDFLEQRITGFSIVGTDPITGQSILAPVFAIFDESATESGLIAEFEISKKFEHALAGLEYSRAVSPSSRGAQTISDDILAKVSFDLSPRWTMQLHGEYNMRSTQSDATTPNRGFLDRDQLMFSGAIQYKVTEELSVTSMYRFYWNQQSISNSLIYNNGLFVTLAYNGQPHFYRGY